MPRGRPRNTAIAAPPATRRRANNRPQVPFAYKLVLNQWLLSLFNVKNFEALAENLRSESLEGLDENNVHHFHHALTAQLFNLTPLPTELLLEYDQNIVKHTQRLNERRLTRGEAPIVWKYFQYLTLLFTEIYLDRYFRDPQGLLGALNAQATAYNTDKPEADRIVRFDEQSEAWPQLNKLAYWSATGSGKTLLMHANILQYQYYLEKHGRRRELNRIILLTPNEGLSLQHLREFETAGISAELFNKDGRGLFAGQAVEILDIHKLKDEMGDKTIAIDAFEGNNLVLVDEGHRGASSGEEGAWMRFRNALCEKGFSFEYSATFGQAVKGNKALTDLYAKSILFDYSYRYFYGDGFGKDYQILNLDEGTQQNHLEMYLVACLMAFFQQQRLYREQETVFRPFNIDRPLWIFVGGSVTKTLATRDASDIIEILRFLARYVADRAGSIQRIDRVLNQGLVTADGRNLFAGRFTYLNTAGISAAQVFEETLATLFNAPGGGSLYVENLKGATGEIALRVGDNEPFGVINVGDDAKLCKLCEEWQELTVAEREFSGSLFHEISKPQSTINLLIGSKKFTEGWNSWRVSGMGLLNVGRSEGSEIVQMFGRGVRLKGLDRSLKRSTALPGSHPPHIGALETLNIFSINGDYLRDFKRALEREGIADYEELELPLQYSLFDDEQPKLYTMRVKPGFQFASAPGFPLEPVEDNAIVPVIDLRPHIQAVSSQADEVAVQAESPPVYLDEVALQLLDWEAIYAEMLAWKRQRGFHNLLFSRDALRAILAEGRYVLYAPETTVRPAFFGALPRLEAIALAILKKYAERFYTQARKHEEARHLEYWPLDKSHENMRPVVLADGRPGYIVKVNRRKPDLVEAVAELIREGERLYREDLEKLPNVYFDRHLYQPLLSAGLFDGDTFKLVQDIKTVPTGLNRGEVRFPFRLRAFLKARPAHLGQRRLYLLRNQSRGKGIGFFEADNFYPDFIVWVVDKVRQRIVFVDPKGLVMLKPNDFSHPKIQLYRTLQDIAAQLGNPDVSLDSYILSDQAFARTWPLFGTGRHTRDEFNQHHVLFPEDTNLATAIIG